MIGELAILWKSLTNSYKVNEKISEEVFAKILQNYQEFHRYYHNLEHISELLCWSQKFENKLNNSETVQFSIWFHDIIYKSHRKDNEVRSADFAKLQLKKMQIPKKIIKMVCEYILATKSHQAPNDIDLQYFLDFDLAILGASPLKYEKYQKAVRKEYSFVPDFLYRKARKKVLQNFLGRSQIFFQLTDLEEIARKNIQNELNG